MDNTKTLITSVKHFFSGTMLSRITGVLRDIAMAYSFGASSTTAAFFVAYRLAHLFRRVFGEGAMQTAFVPKFEEIRGQNPKRAYLFFRDLSLLIALVLLALILAASLGITALLSYGALTPGNTEIANLTLLMLPSLLFICLYGMNSSLLQCDKYYFLPSASPVFFNLTWILGALAIYRLQPQNPMEWLAGCIILSCLAQWLATLPKTLNILKENGIANPLEKVRLNSSDLRNLAKPFLLGVIGIAAAQINSALDGVFARYADSEGPAFLWYAIRIQQVPIGLFAVAFSGALLPPLSRAAKSQDRDKFHGLLKYSLKKCLLIMVPFTLVIFLFGKLGIQIVYGRGHFDENAVAGTSQCLNAYALGLIPMSCVLLLAPAFYSRNNYGITTSASLISMLTNTVLNAVFVMGLGLGAVSVALATSLAAWVNFLILAAAMFRPDSLCWTPEAETRKLTE